jgi:hypothetical protein
VMRLFLIERNGGRKIDLGLYKFNGEPQCINAAKRRHKFLEKMETNGFEYKGQLEQGPLRHPKAPAVSVEQLCIQT